MGTNTKQEFATEKLSGMYLRVTMPDGSKWDVPVRHIAISRAIEYAHEFGDDVNKSLKQDTIQLFLEDDYAITDWAANNMNWEDVAYCATRVKGPPEPDYQEGWMNGEKEVVKKAGK